MLDLAINAGIPVIHTSTSDIINVRDVLSRLTDMPVVEFTQKPGFEWGEETVHYYLSIEEDFLPDRKLFNTLVDNSSVLVLINAESKSPYGFDAGEMPVPRVLLLHYLSQVCDKPTEYVQVATGLTIKQLVEVVKLTQTGAGQLTVREFRNARAMVVGAQRGLSQVNLGLQGYQPDPKVKDWVDLNKQYFLTPKDHRLVPRGILLDGPPGTGKTLAAKEIAFRMGVPLYRLDLSSSLGKYVGESESNLSRILSTVDREEPCVMLLDEIEKIFGEKDDSGVTSRLLSQILWWLQEHDSRVLTIMTTNDAESLPKELIRAGRIDTTLNMDELDVEKGVLFTRKVLLDFLGDGVSSKIVNQLREEVHSQYESNSKIAHATLVAGVYEFIKRNSLI